MSSRSRDLTRREFLETSALLTGGGVLAGGLGLAKGLFAGSEPEKKGTVEYRTLGRTGLKISSVSLGTMNATDPAVVDRALDLGINYIDTARGYQGGQNEKMVGSVLERRRGETYIGTKCGVSGSVDGIVASVEESLRALRTDVIDIIQFHGIERDEHLTWAPAIEAFGKLRDQGKVRFVGVTYHTRMAELTRALAKNDFWDTALVAYNFNTEESLSEAIREAAKAGKGIIAMKTQGGGFQTSSFEGATAHQASLKWVLQNEGVTGAVPGVTTIQQLEEDFAASGKRLSLYDRLRLEGFARASAGKTCLMCGDCDGSCPEGVKVREVNRALMYAECYRDAALGKLTYEEIPPTERASACVSCSGCKVRCRGRLDIAGRMRRAHALLA